MRSHIATAYKRNIRFLPYAFTENGAIMAANVLNSTPHWHFTPRVIELMDRSRVPVILSKHERRPKNQSSGGEAGCR